MGVAVFRFPVFAAAQVGSPVLTATAIITGGLLTCQMILHPLWCWGGHKLASLIAGKPRERALMASLALLTVPSVLSVLLMGDQA